MLRLAAALILALLPSAAAHLPQIPTDNTTLATAHVVDDPSVPVALYDRLDGAEPRYYRMDLAAGDRVPLLLFVPPDETIAAPRLALLGPGIVSNETPPEFVEVPPGYGARLVVVDRPGSASFEPLTPSAYRIVSSVDLVASLAGTHYVAVYDFGPTRFGLAVGAGERAGLADWAALPVRRATLFEWEGQGPWLWRAPSIVAGAAGVGLLLWRWRGRARPSPYELLGAIAALLMASTAPSIAYEAWWAASRAAPTWDLLAIALLVILGPLACGGLAAAFSLRDPERVTIAARAGMAAAGIGAFACFAGYGAAPWVAVLAAFLPADRLPIEADAPVR